MIKTWKNFWHHVERGGAIVLSSGIGNWWCPDCGQWIEPGTGKVTLDHFMVHEQCR